MASGEVRAAEENVVPSEMYLMARNRSPANDKESPLAAEIRNIATETGCLE